MICFCWKKISCWSTSVKMKKVLRTKVSVNNSLKLMLNYAKSCYQNQISDKWLISCGEQINNTISNINIILDWLTPLRLIACSLNNGPSTIPLYPPNTVHAFHCSLSRLSSSLILKAILRLTAAIRPCPRRPWLRPRPLITSPCWQSSRWPAQAGQSQARRTRGTGYSS